jgi:hypothetical protein
MAHFEVDFGKRIISAEHITSVACEYVFEAAKTDPLIQQYCSRTAHAAFEIMTAKTVKDLDVEDVRVMHNPLIPTATVVSLNGNGRNPFDDGSGHRFVLVHCGGDVCLMHANNTDPDRCTLREFREVSTWSEFRKPMSAVEFDLWIERFCTALDKKGDERALAFKNLIGIAYEGKVDASCFVQAPIVLPWS